VLRSCLVVHVLEVVCCRLVSLIREPVTLSVASFEAFSAAYQAHINVVVAMQCEVGSFFDLCFVLVLQIHIRMVVCCWVVLVVRERVAMSIADFEAFSAAAEFS